MYTLPYGEISSSAVSRLCLENTFFPGMKMSTPEPTTGIPTQAFKVTVAVIMIIAVGLWCHMDVAFW